MKLSKNKYFPFLVIFLATLVFFLPIFINPKLFVDRNNDLQEFFWPIYYFVKEQIIKNHQIPFWNNMILSGTPLLPDPQAPIFYPLNIIFLFLPINTAFIISFILHSFIGGIGMYFCSKDSFKFSAKTALFLALFYLTTPKLAGYLEAGHVGLINSLAWLPFALLGSLKLREKPNLKHALILGTSLALLYYSHLPTFLIIAFTFGLLALRRKTILYLLLAAGITFGLTAISLLPQLEWQKYSTRYLLLQDKDVYPKWNSVWQPVRNMIIPWSQGLTSLEQIETEKWLAIGLIPTLLAFWGFLKLKIRHKIFTLSGVFFIFLIILNNASPIYPLLLKQNWYLLLRVSTRFWILILLATIYLSGLALNETKSKFIYFFAVMGILESTLLGWLYLQKPIIKNENLAPKEVFDYLTTDRSLFRVFCLTRCLSQKQAAIYQLQLLDGYNTLQQKNFYQHAWQLTGVYWNYYTLSIPPLGTFTQELKPDAKSLGQYNVKYIISPYQLTDKNFILKTKLKNFFIFENKLFIPRVYDIYKPNYIKVNVNEKQKQLIVSEVYSPGWKAYLNGSQKVPVQETPNSLRAVDIQPETKFVDFKYHPDSYKTSKFLTLISILFILGLGIKNFLWKK